MDSAELFQIVAADDNQLELAFAIIWAKCRSEIAPHDAELIESFARRILSGRHFTEKMRKVALSKISIYKRYILPYWGKVSMNKIRKDELFHEIYPDIFSKLSETKGPISIRAAIPTGAFEEAASALGKMGSPIESEWAKGVDRAFSEETPEVSHFVPPEVFSRLRKFAAEASIDTAGRPIGIFTEHKKSSWSTLPESLSSRLFVKDEWSVWSIGLKLKLCKDKKIVFEEEYNSHEEMNMAIEHMKEIINDSALANTVFGGGEEDGS